MRDLTNSAFKVYIYLLENKDNYIIGLSPADIYKNTGVCIDTVRRSICELESK